MVGNPRAAVRNFANSLVFAHDGCIQHTEMSVGEVDAINAVKHLMVVRLASRKPIRIWRRPRVAGLFDLVRKPRSIRIA